MACIALDICFIQILRQFQQYFSHIARVSGCGRERSVHFESAASQEILHPRHIYSTQSHYYDTGLSISDF